MTHLSTRFPLDSQFSKSSERMDILTLCVLSKYEAHLGDAFTQIEKRTYIAQSIPFAHENNLLHIYCTKKLFQS